MEVWKKEYFFRTVFNTSAESDFSRYNTRVSNLVADLDLQKAVKLNDTRSVGEVFAQPADLINLVVPNLFLIAGTILFFMILGGGFQIIASGSADAVDKGKNQVTLAILGMVIMFAAYWIIQLVEYLTGVKILSN
jgi:hypothetical protein